MKIKGMMIIAVMLTVMLFFVSSLYAQTEEVKIILSGSDTATPGNPYTIKVNYDQTDTLGTYGIQVFICFDDSKLTFNSAGTSVSFRSELLFAAPAAIDDTTVNKDNDPETNKYVEIFWDDGMTADFPYSDGGTSWSNLPVELATVGFTVNSTATGTTKLNVVADKYLTDFYSFSGTGIPTITIGSSGSTSTSTSTTTTSTSTTTTSTSTTTTTGGGGTTTTTGVSGTTTTTLCSRSGDVSGDGSTKIYDAQLAAKHDAGLASPALTPAQISAGDMNCNGTLDILDALKIAETALWQ